MIQVYSFTSMGVSVAHRASLAVVALAVGVMGCGSKHGGQAGAPVHGKLGGTLTALWAGDLDSVDPGITYTQFGTQIVRATQKTLYRPKVDDATAVEPDLAATRPAISADGCRVTVALKRGVQFSPPVSRNVTSADVKYAIERGFFSSVNNGYAGAYFGGLRGAKAGVAPGTRLPGITTPDGQTVVFDLERPPGSTRCAGVVLAGALSMPLSAPVPEELAGRFDAGKLSTYGIHQVATGPYMIESYEPGRRIHLVRNPRWSADLDTRPAYLDEIEIREGNDDAALASRRVLEGKSMINGEQPPPPAVLQSALARRREQIQLAPSGGARWISMNTTIPPFDDLDVRRAVIAGFNRNAMRLTYGGEASGDMPSHFLPPGVPGFDEAGGLEGQGLDYMSRPGGDPHLAAEYFRKAGFPSGSYESDRTFLMVGETAGPGADAALVAQQEFTKLGFHVRLQRVDTVPMFTKFCGVPKAAVAICPNVGWLKDFADPETFLSPTFNGEHILPAGNANWSQLDDRALNARMQRASVLAEPAERARAWAAVDAEITRLAAAIPYLWPRWANLRSENVVGTIDQSTATWSLAHTRLR